MDSTTSNRIVKKPSPPFPDLTCPAIVFHAGITTPLSMSLAHETIGAAAIAPSSAGKPNQASYNPEVEEICLATPVAQSIDQCYGRLCRFAGVEGAGGENATLNRASSRKLQKLTLGQLNELLMDICDEGERRSGGVPSESFLMIRLEYSPKRNQARQKLADLADPRLAELIASVKGEIERRFPHLAPAQPATEVERSDDDRSKLEDKFDQLAASLTSLPELAPPTPTLSQMERVIEASTAASSAGAPSAVTPNTPKPQLSISPPPTERTSDSRAQHLASLNWCCGTAIERHAFNYDCLEALIQDLERMIYLEQNNQLEQLKQRHTQGMDVLKKYIQRLEEQVLPAKDQEIAKLTARIGELEDRLATALREHTGCTAKVACCGALTKTIQRSYMQLQTKAAPSALMQSPSKSNLLEDAATGRICGSIADLAGLFSKLWMAFSDAHGMTVTLFGDAEASTADRLSALKEAVSIAQNLIREAERLVTRSDVQSLVWIASDLRILNEAKTQGVQALSYCIVCCRDLGNKLCSYRQVQEAILQLAPHVRTLVDAAKLVISRAQVPSLCP